jgi:hypothetical protein
VVGGLMTSAETGNRVTGNRPSPDVSGFALGLSCYLRSYSYKMEARDPYSGLPGETVTRLPGYPLTTHMGYPA